MLRVLLRTILAVWILAASMWLPGSAAFAQNTCDLRSRLIAALQNQFGEKPIGVGLGFDGTLYELLIGPNGSWTLLISRANGWSCIAASGTDWQTVTRTPMV
jgi:hypothetical protein